MIPLCFVSGVGSVDEDALTMWDTTTSTVTGTTVTQDLKAATVRGKKLTRSGDAMTLRAVGQFAGTVGTKQLFAVIGGTTVSFTAASASTVGLWQVEIDLTYNTGSSVRYVAKLFTPTGVELKQGAASADVSADWALALRGDLSNGADSITCTQIRIE